MGQYSPFIVLDIYRYIGSLVKMGISMKKFDIKYIL